MKSLTFFLSLLIALALCGQTKSYDLAIKNATVFDSKSGTVSKNQIILIKAGIIVVVTKNKKDFLATKTIDAKGRLITPGFIDTHIHPTDVFGDYNAAPEYLPKDSLMFYRKKLSDTYLPYGVTTAMIMGQPEKWLQPILSWTADPLPNYLDIYTVGGALISNESRKPYINHITVESPLAAKQKVLEYYKLGIRHIKLYWRLHKPEFEAAFKTADSLGMKIYGHIDQNVMFMDTTLDIGLRNYEHILTLDNSILHFQNDGKNFSLQMQKYYAPTISNFPLVRLEMFRFIHDKNKTAMDSLINKLSKNKATFSTTIHLMAEQFGLTYFINKTDTLLSKEQIARCKESFKIFMSYVKQLFDKGIKLRIGTDCANGGKAIISEQLLLFENGFSVPAILQISTINGATALGLDNKYGSIEKGKRADILIWEKSPFDDYKNFLATKTIIKDGVVYKN
ncbi:MAG: amidohydrolase family protein [Chitinophagaceae bacterium]|nr:amidohydrolase family protein [Chitinophagaceae bacterium]